MSFEPRSPLLLLLIGLVACGPEADPSEPLADVATAATAPSRGHHGLRIANWNIQWLGAPDKGPSDERLQLANALRVLAAGDADIWVVEEISAPTAFGALLRGLPERDGVLASDPDVENGARYYRGDEQRVGVIWDARRADLLSARLILLDHNDDFAGRPPLQVELHLTLEEGELELTLIALHMKAFGDLASHDRRARAALALHAYLSALPAGRAVLVAGDWNDDLNGSLTAGQTSPFSDLASDPALSFLTQTLADAGVPSIAGGRHFIDHQLANQRAAKLLVPGSTRLLPVDALIPNYVASTSDHFPVVSDFDLHRALIINEILANEPGRDRAGEAIELLAANCEHVRLDGLSLGDARAPHNRLAGAMSRVRVVRGPGGLGLSNTGGAVVLYDADGSVLERVDYDASLAAIDGMSMTRAIDGDADSPLRLHRAVAARDSSLGLSNHGVTFGCP